MTARLGAIDAARVGWMLAWSLRSQWWPADRIRDYQRRMLVDSMRHAATRVPYYAGLNIAPASLRDFADLQRFPILGKDIVQQHGEQLMDREARREHLHVSRTSGSSSEPTDTWFDRRCWLLTKYALKIRRTLLAGRRFGARILVLGEQPEEPARPRSRALTSLLYSKRTVSVFEPQASQYRTLMDAAPDVIYGAPSAIAEMVSHAETNALPLPVVPTIFTSAELLTLGTRARIEAAFRGRVMDVYGSTEFKEMAFQCEHGRYHLNFESVYVEALPAENGDSTATPDIAITSLVNRAMPLLRFRIGDHARITHVDCPCGRHSPCLTELAGREAEYLSVRDGRRISPYLLTTAIETCRDIRKYQIIQRGPDRIDVQVVVAGSADQAPVGQLRAALRNVLGESVQVAFEVVDQIERTRAGKHQIVRRAQA